MFTNKDVVMDPSTTSATSLGDIGQLMWYPHPTYGMQCYRHIKLDTAVSAVTGQVIACKLGGSGTNIIGVLAPVTSTRLQCLGVVQNTVAAGYYCWALVWGAGLGLSNGETPGDAEINVAGAAGSISDAAASAADPGEYIGRCFATVTDTTGVCEFRIL